MKDVGTVRIKRLCDEEETVEKERVVSFYGKRERCCGEAEESDHSPN
jgi:hypothetical protein